MDIRVFSRHDIEAGILMDLQDASPNLRLACISITDPDCAPAKILVHRGDSVKILRLQFHDVDLETELRSGRTYISMASKQVHLIVDFLRGIQDRVDLLVVHCEMGISRSAAVAAACCSLLGLDDRSFFSEPYKPNQYCYDLILDVANELKNVDAAVLEVHHAELERYSDKSAYRSRCPVCPKGVLLVGRDPVTLELLEYDRCITCGQQIRYLDIEVLRQRERGGATFN